MKAEKKRLIFSLSYLSVPFVLKLIEESSTLNIIVTTNKSLYNFYKKIYPTSEIQFVEKNGFAINHSLLKNIVRAYRKRNQLLRLYDNFQGYDVYFFEDVSAFNIYSLIIELRNRNDIYFCRASKIDGPVKISMLAFLTCIFIKQIYKIDVVPLNFGYETNFKLKQKYFTKNNIKLIKINPKNIEWDKYLTANFNLTNHRYLILAGSVVSMGMVDKVEYEKKINEIISMLGNGNCASKMHPRYNDYIGEEKNIYQLPAEIPASCIIRNFKIVIGYGSSALYEAANENITSISLIDLMISNSPKRKIGLKKVLIDNCNNPGFLYFPKSISELKEVVHPLTSHFIIKE